MIASSLRGVCSPGFVFMLLLLSSMGAGGEANALQLNKLATLEYKKNPHPDFGDEVSVRNLTKDKIEVTVKMVGTNNDGTKAEKTTQHFVLPEAKEKVGSTKAGFASSYQYSIVTAKKL